MVYESLEAYRPTEKGIVLALGMFDGVHIGHRELLKACVELAGEMHALPAALTFATHPDTFSQQSHRALMTCGERAEALHACGMADVFMLPFTQAVMATPGDAYISMLVTKLNVQGLVAGYDYTYGAGAACGQAQLRALGEKLGIAVRITEAVCSEGAPVSSTLIREAIARGELEKANALLGAPYSVTGTVLHGRAIGRTMGFPTANIVSDKVLPAVGVYVTGLTYDGVTHPAVTNVGRNPTVAEGGDLRMETHVLDDAPQLYGREVQLHFYGRIRSEVRFSGLDELKAQIARDKETALMWFSGK